MAIDIASGGVAMQGSWNMTLLHHFAFALTCFVGEVGPLNVDFSLSVAHQGPTCQLFLQSWI